MTPLSLFVTAFLAIFKVTQHVTGNRYRKTGPREIVILVPSFKTTCYFPMMIHILGRYRSQIWPDFEIQQACDLDFDLG